MPNRKAKNEVRAADVKGLKYFKRLRPLLAKLHDSGTARDRAGNRQLHLDEYCTLILLWLFSPAVDSLRGLQQAAELKKVQKKLRVPRAALGSLSEAVSVFEPQRVKRIAAELAAETESLGSQTPWPGVEQTVIAVDGSVVDTVSSVARAAWLPTSGGRTKAAWRLHTHFEVLRGLPRRIDVTGANPKGEADERAVLERTLERDCCYVCDRGYAKFKLFNRIVAAGSSYVVRLRDNSTYGVVQERPLSDEAREAGLVSDQIVRLGRGHEPDGKPDHTVRLVILKAPAHTRRGKYKGGGTGPSCDGYLRIATNLLDVPAEVLADLYRHRWTIEIFFRFFKHILGCRHLLSTKENGIEIQCYCAIIACLLLALYTGRKPTKRTYEMICFYLSGWADEEEMEAHLGKLQLAS